MKLRGEGRSVGMLWLERGKGCWSEVVVCNLFIAESGRKRLLSDEQVTNHHLRHTNAPATWHESAIQQALGAALPCAHAVRPVLPYPAVPDTSMPPPSYHNIFCPPAEAHVAPSSPSPLLVPEHVVVIFSPASPHHRTGTCSPSPSAFTLSYRNMLSSSST